MNKLFVFGSFLLLVGFSAFSFAQARDAEAAASVARSVPQMTKRQPTGVDLSRPAQMTVSPNTVFSVKTGRVVGEASVKGTSTPKVNAIAPTGGGNVDGLDTIATFDGSFAAQNGPSTGQQFRFTMIGNNPLTGVTTPLPSQIDEVSLTLLNGDGSTFAVVPFAPFENLTLRSPNFQRSNYASGFQTQFADAEMRAEFFNKMRPGWHNVMLPGVVNRVNITVPKFVNIQLSDGSIIQARSYFTGTAADGSTFVLMLDLLFNFFFDNEVVNEIELNNFTTAGINMTLFPNTFLFSLNIDNPNTPGECCVLGFHTYFYDPSTVPQQRWVTLYASWISPGLFGAGFQDITALSHEISESFNDPFIDNFTPIWQFPGQPANSTFCQGNLEVGDPIEVLPNATTTVTLPIGRGAFYTYHPQNMALFQWFEMGATSSALNGAWSFPDPVLTASAVPCPD
jgi:hypothetical protein